ncbi:MAG: beta-lactamase family protein [Thermomicrobiales bacterium]|nr:beta-lactamase family protein [Thermomicrobiales bacterium]
MLPSSFDRIARGIATRSLRPATRRGVLRAAGAALVTGGLGKARGAVRAEGTPEPDATPTAATPAAILQAEPAQAVVAIARDAMTRYDLRALIARVTIAGEELVTLALGESMTGVPATVDMRFRNGAVAISYLSTLLLVLVDRGMAGLDDPLTRWMPELPDADRVTLRMLTNMTAGYPDYVQNQDLLKALYVDPFRQWAPEELIAIGLSTPRVFAPGENWDYSHTNYVILGRTLERMTGTPMDVLMQQYILDPLGLRDTQGSSSPAIPEPALHAFTAERRDALGIPADVRFLEESTYWNPSWTLAQGAIQTTTIFDMTTTADAIGAGTLLTSESHHAQIDPRLLGFGKPLAGCPNCHTLDRRYNYGLGVVLSGPWILQNPLFYGYGALEAYLPSKQLAVAVAVTFAESAFDDQGNYRNGFAAQSVLEAIAGQLAPGEEPGT